MFQECKDVSRIRFYCYDPEAYFNERAVTYTSLYMPEIEKKEKKNETDKQFKHVTKKINIEDKKLNKVVNDIQENHINIAESYENWLKIAVLLYNEFEEEGRKIFHIISSQSKKYDKFENDDLYDNISN